MISFPLSISFHNNEFVSQHVPKETSQVIFGVFVCMLLGTHRFNLFDVFQSITVIILLILKLENEHTI